jgi:hypothetical protein
LEIAIGLAALGLTACAASDGAEPLRETSWGSAVVVGQGTARSYVETVAGVTVEVGIALSEAALEGLPTHHDAGGVAMPDGHRMFEYVIDLPAGSPTPFRHVLLNWNPGGHEPPGIYDTPHFDFHFYTISNEERKTIDPGQPHWVERARRLPPAARIPTGYLAGSTLMQAEPEVASVPGMGMHWIDPRSPELNGQPFTTTFIFGSWDGKVTFAEPMITKAFLESRQDFTADLPAPAEPAPGMYYPTSYRVRFDAATAEYKVSLGSPLAGS